MAGEGKGVSRAAPARPRMEVRPARIEDLGVIAGIELQVYPNPWHPNTFRSLLEQARAVVLAAEDPAGEVVGYAVFWWVLDQGELANLAVKKERQGEGIGGALLDEAVRGAELRGVESLFLEVRISNHSARRLYASRGFRQISVRGGYYQNPREDALVLLKHLIPSRDEDEKHL